ncbi:MAG: hybrid sensor histidine kinase/response regulator [Geobacter sp.]|nr:MAG: hybrid sensor histidine kinase/response regulator [Geobacter sp.]
MHSTDNIKTTPGSGQGDPCRFLAEIACPHLQPVNLEECGTCQMLGGVSDPALLHTALKGCFRTIREQEQVIGREQETFAHDFSDISRMVDHLCKGDPAIRIASNSNITVVNRLAEMLNHLAASMQEMIDDSHEMAIGLCEHYDTLNRLASGDFKARASVDSPNELIAKLGMLINRESETMLSTIAELQKTDEELKTAYQQLQDIIEFLPDATFIIDSEKRIIAWNKALEEMTGFAKEAMTGKGDHEYSIPFYGVRRWALVDFIDDFNDGISEHYHLIEKKGDMLLAEKYIHNFRDDRGIHLWITASPLFDRNGNRIGAIESIRDITSFKLAEEQKASLELQLIQAQKMEAIGQLAGGIAHDFNNILTAIIGYGHLLQNKSREDQVAHRYVSQILVASEKASRLTRDLLTFSRKQVMNLTPINLNEAISSIGDMLSRLIGDDIELNIELQDEPISVLVDVGQIQQVVMNLVTNARDAMPEGGTISIATFTRQPELEPARQPPAISGRYAVISVSDNGLGMDQKTSEKIFEPFFTTKETGKGTGLGLSIVYGIVTQHNGFIEVQSSMGQGTTVRAHLPLVNNPSDKSKSEILACIPFDQGGTETILLAEDNTAAREVFKDILEGAGYKVLCAVDGNDAVEAFKLNADRIRMVVLDVVMPKKNGSQVLKELKAMRPGVKHLFLSGNIADIIHDKEELEADLHFLPKPVLPNALLSKVREILDETVLHPAVI